MQQFRTRSPATRRLLYPWRGAKPESLQFLSSLLGGGPIRRRSSIFLDSARSLRRRARTFQALPGRVAGRGRLRLQITPAMCPIWTRPSIPGTTAIVAQALYPRRKYPLGSAHQGVGDIHIDWIVKRGR